MFIIYFLFPIILCENLIQNPSFEEMEGDKLKYWKAVKGSDISSNSHSGKNSPHWKPQNKSMITLQDIYGLEKDFQYEICVYYKLKNILKFQMVFANNNKSEGYKEYYYSKILNGTNNDWKLFCYRTGNLQRSSGKYDIFYLGIYTHAQIDDTAEAFIDDVFAYRVNDIIRVGINNDRDEVYDIINVICEIKNKKGKYSLNDWELYIRIKDDNNNEIYYEKEEEIISSLFTVPINIKNIGLKDGIFYRVEGVVKSKIDSTIDMFSYPFKKIKKINREIAFDKYGRMTINGKVFFPFGAFVMGINESNLIDLNETHFNFILPYSKLK